MIRNALRNLLQIISKLTNFSSLAKGSVEISKKESNLAVGKAANRAYKVGKLKYMISSTGDLEILQTKTQLKVADQAQDTNRLEKSRLNNKIIHKKL